MGDDKSFPHILVFQKYKLNYHNNKITIFVELNFSWIFHKNLISQS